MSEGARGITAIKDAPAGSWLWPRLFFFFLIMIPPCPVGTEELVTQRAGSSVLPMAAGGALAARPRLPGLRCCGWLS